MAKKKAAKKGVQRKPAVRRATAGTAQKAAAKPLAERRGLTERHVQVVRLLSLGCTVKEAGKILGLSPSTVDNHKTEAMSRLGTTKLALLTRLAVQDGISSLDDKLTPAEKRKRGRKEDGWN